MDLESLLPTLLGLAWLLPLASFAVILFAGPRLGDHGKGAAGVATAAIVGSFVLSLMAFISWVAQHPVHAVAHDDHGGAHASATVNGFPDLIRRVAHRVIHRKCV